MATLNDMKTITPVLMLKLSGDDWTVDLLATASPGQLRRYRGVGHVLAKKIIAEAQQIVNESLLQESAGQNDVVYISPEPVEVQKSVRVRRAEQSAKEDN